MEFFFVKGYKDSFSLLFSIINYQFKFVFLIKGEEEKKRQWETFLTGKIFLLKTITKKSEVLFSCPFLVKSKIKE